MSRATEIGPVAPVSRRMGISSVLMIDDGALTQRIETGTYAITHVGAGSSSSSKNVESSLDLEGTCRVEDDQDRSKGSQRLDRLLHRPGTQGGRNIHAHEATHKPEAGIVDVRGEH